MVKGPPPRCDMSDGRGGGRGDTITAMRCGFMCALLAVGWSGWSGCSMPNPAWTASDSALDPSTSLPETDSVGNTTVLETTTEGPTTVTADPTVTEPTSGTATSDPTTTSTTSTSTSTTTSTSTSTTTGETICAVDDSLALNLEREMSVDPAPFDEPTFPACEDPEFFVGEMNLNDGLKVTGVGGPCQGGTMGSWLKLTGSYPDGAQPPLAVGSCARVYVHYVADADAGVCRLAAYQIFQGPNFENGAAPLYAAGSGVIKLGAIVSGMDSLKDYSPTEVEGDCVADPMFCEEPEGTELLQWSQLDPNLALPESAGPEDCGDGYSCYNLRAHRHGDDGDQSCAYHLDWIITKKQ